MNPPEKLPDIQEATRGLVRTVDGLSDDDFTLPSLLPGWSRAHVVAHLALNAEGLAGVLRGVSAGRPTTMYASQEDRDADIETLANAPTSELRDRFLASTTEFHEAALHVAPDSWEEEFDRTPGGATLPVSGIPAMRHREVEIHHADLDTAYTAADWPAPFLERLFTSVVRDRSDGPAMLLRTPDGDVAVGNGGPVVSGSRAALTWWLLGRGTGEGLTADPELPTLGPWR